MFHKKQKNQESYGNKTQAGHYLIERREIVNSFRLEKGDNADDRALETAREILSTHQPDELDPKVSEEMAKIIASEEN